MNVADTGALDESVTNAAAYPRYAYMAEKEGKFGPVVVLCGSTRFAQAFELLNLHYTMQGYIVLSIGQNVHDDKLPLTEEKKAALDALHKRKIEMADIVVILDVGNYMGDSTRSELDHAIKLGKKILYFSSGMHPSNWTREGENWQRAGERYRMEYGG